MAEQYGTRYKLLCHQYCPCAVLTVISVIQVVIIFGWLFVTLMTFSVALSMAEGKHFSKGDSLPLANTRES
jgi:hypothetical protein